MDNIPEIMRRYKHIFIAEGVIFTLLGLFAMSLPQVFSLTLDYFFGWLFVIGALALGARAILTPDMPNKTNTLLSTLLYLILGILLLVYPMSGILTLTLLMGVYFLFDGIAKIYGGIEMKPMHNWGWIVTNCVLSLILALLIFGSWPSQASWVLGVLFGINLFITGIITLAFMWSISKKAP